MIPSSSSTAITLRKTASIASPSESPNPSKSRSRVPRCGAVSQVINRVAPLSTKRPRVRRDAEPVEQALDRIAVEDEVEDLSFGF